MAWIDPISRFEATGLLKRIYDDAVQRAGRIYNVIALQSRQPRVLESSTQLYLRLMHARGEPLSRAQREMIAVVVSQTNACAY